MDRGIIASPGIIKRQSKGFRMERSLSIDELRYYILYWDKVVIPANNLVYIGIPEEDLFIESGALERPRVGFNGRFEGDQVTDAILSCQSVVAKELLKDKTTDWVIHQIGDECIFPSNFNQSRNTIRVDLASSLPVPIGEVNVYELLEFKEKRKDELESLHSHLDSLYEHVLSSIDQDLSSKKAVSGLAKSISDLDSVTKERFVKSRKFDLTAELNLSGKDILVGAASGALIDSLTSGLTIPVATIAGAIISSVKVQSKASNTFRPAEHNLKLSFLASAKNESFL